MHPAFEAVRTYKSESVDCAAFAMGQTGFPFVDACMRYLKATGWINFRMRAMLTAFATYHLQLDWQDVGRILARLFTDYEPGIHWPQIQMQSGQTGINTPRIYNPVKQSMEQDENGVFIRRWLPELALLPTSFLHQPWTLTEAEQKMYNVVLGETYPVRLVDHVAAMQAARARLTDVRRGEDFRQTAQVVYQRHGSRKGAVKRTAVKPKKTKSEKPIIAKAQLSFDL